MRVKRFVAKDIHEAMAKVKQEMGNEAIILHTRYFKEGGFMGLFKKNYVEVTAATETAVAVKTVDRKVERPLTQVVDLSAKKEVKENSSELEQMKQFMDDMLKQIEDLSGAVHFPKLGQELFVRLKKQEIDEKIAQRIVKSTLQNLSTCSKISEDEVIGALSTNLLKPLKKSKPITVGKRTRKTPLVFPFVGPTGVGKTTTIAKLAAMFAITEQKRVALVTIDTYRIAAVEQLRTIGDIMNIPVKVVFSPNNLQECLYEMIDNDIIFIDTAGRSHKNAMQIAEISGYLSSIEADDIFLVLSGTSKGKDLFDIIDTYQSLNVSKLIFTKLDETSNYGPIYNVAHKTKIPLSYFTNGQNIPDDIDIADPTRLVQLILKEHSV